VTVYTENPGAHFLFGALSMFFVGEKAGIRSKKERGAPWFAFTISIQSMEKTPPGGGAGARICRASSPEDPCGLNMAN
jgi:hypothetical protein